MLRLMQIVSAVTAAKSGVLGDPNEGSLLTDEKAVSFLHGSVEGI